jgi:hypothetical protein
MTLSALLLLFTTAGASATSCETLRAQIETKIRAAGVTVFTLEVVDAGQATAGRAVGTCDQGAKKIVYTQGPSADRPPATATKPPATRRSDAILTECKDGSVSVGGDCRK